MSRTKSDKDKKPVIQPESFRTLKVEGLAHPATILLGCKYGVWFLWATSGPLALRELLYYGETEQALPRICKALKISVSELESKRPSEGNTTQTLIPGMTSPA